MPRHHGTETMNDPTHAALHWLVGDCQLFGLTVQNWMPLMIGMILVYIAALAVISRRNHQRVR
jgi:hypothetical protein